MHNLGLRINSSGLLLTQQSEVVPYLPACSAAFCLSTVMAVKKCNKKYEGETSFCAQVCSFHFIFKIVAIKVGY